jgi:SAM-dependent methyltransferase
MEDTGPFFEPVWEEEVYRRGRQFNRYPFDLVVSFVHHFSPRDKPRDEIRILEVGCGAGNNLWFASREGFQVAGIDASPTAIAYARKRFAEESLAGDLHVGNFTRLPFEDGGFDIAIDRCAITNCRLTDARLAVEEVKRVLRPGGTFLFNPYSTRHTSHVSGRPGSDGLTVDISTGGLEGMGPIYFYGRREIENLFDEGWKLISLRHVESVEVSQPQYTVQAEWRAIVEKIS